MAVCITVYQMLMINEKAIHPYPVMAVRMPINLLFHSNIIEFCKLITLLLMVFKLNSYQLCRSYYYYNTVIQ